MKHSLMIFGIVFFGAFAAHAQTDTLRDERNQIPNDLPVPQPRENPDRDLILIPNSDLPATLRQSLLNELYAGWETEGVYKSKTTGEYSIETKTAGGTQKFRFDDKGQPITGTASSPGMTPN
jgi:hypothetical protein